MNVPLKVPFYYELVNVWKAMLMAYGLVDEEGITYLDREKTFCGKDVRAGILKKKEHGNHLNFSELKLEEQIEYAENRYKQRACEQPNINIGQVICYY